MQHIKNALLKIDSSLSKVLNHWQKLFAPLGPLQIPLYHYCFALLLYFVFRALLLVIYWSRVQSVPELYMVFILGMRMDTIIMSYLLGLPALFFVLLPKKIIKFISPALGTFLAFIMAFAIGMELATIPFMAEYDLRPDRIFFEYLKYPKEVFGMILTVRPLFFVFLMAVLFFSFRAFYQLFKRSVENYNPWKWWQRLLLTPLLALLIFLGARSSLGHRPANISTAAFSQNNLVNEITLDSSYSLVYAIYRTRHETSPTAIYGKLGFETVMDEMKNYLPFPAQDLVPESKIPFLHYQTSPFKRQRPLNVVIFLQESMGAEFVGALGGMPLTPKLDALSREGLWFTQMYATGTRTVRGIEATASGFPPTPGSSVVKLGLARRGFFTAGELFKKHGYNTMFIYGGMSNFDEMRSFFGGNGFKQIYDEPTFENPIYKGVWGVSDEDLVIKANEVFKNQKDPFFALMLSTSNHSPFEFPEGRIELYEKPATTMHNALKFADYSIGKLFELAKKEEYYKNTLFVVLADHNTRVYGDEFVPVHKFHIPALIIGPDVPKEHFDLVSSQIDLLPTLFHFTGLEGVHPMIGRNLMQLAPHTPGRAIMQYAENHGYLKGDHLVVHRRYKGATHFIYDFKTQKLAPAQVDSALEREAFIHALYPWHVYEKQLYRMPE